MEQKYISITEYLKQRGVMFKEHGGELITGCLFNGCDDDSRPNEAHLYFNAETSQYDCKKCGQQGNIVTLAKHFGDSKSDILLNKPTRKPTSRRKTNAKVTAEMVEELHMALPERILTYLYERGIKDDTIARYRLGWGNFYGKWWITIPVKDIEGEYSYFKLRIDPGEKIVPNKYMFYPAGSNSTLFGWDMLKGNDDMIVICEGEFDAMLLSQMGVPTVTSTAGASTFKDEWIDSFQNLKKVYVCYDKDDAGEEGSEKLIEMLDKQLKKTAIYRSTLPERMTEGKDVTDYITKYGGNPDELISECSVQVAGKKKIDVSKFKPLNSKDLTDILDLTIKKDEENKLMAFLCCLSAFTEQSQFNLSFNAPSSTGKSFIPLEVSSLFPKEDVMKLGDCSPKAFFHEQGVYDKDTNTMLVDLSRKILIFLDMPHNSLLERLRSLLSHDQKEMVSKITDKNRKGGNQTKTVILRGYPAVIFCSAGLKIDEQEGTRFILLSPQTSQEKLGYSIHEKIEKESDRDAYFDKLNAHPDRQLLMDRIQAIKEEEIGEIRISNPKQIEDEFLSKRKKLKPRHQRDIGRLIGLIKVFALLNVWFREREGNTIISTEEDFVEALKLWDKISVSQEYNLPPFVYDLYQDVILPAYDEKNADVVDDDKMGITRNELSQKYYALHGRFLPEWQLRQDILPMLETAALIMQDQGIDRREKVIYPTERLEINNIVSDTRGTEKTEEQMIKEIVRNL